LESPTATSKQITSQECGVLIAILGRRACTGRRNGGIETTALQQSGAAPAPAIYGDDPKTLSISAEDDTHDESPSAAPCLESDPAAPGSVIPSAAENELLDRAMSMIRSALVKGNRDADA
jgi:hypothetical protein